MSTATTTDAKFVRKDSNFRDWVKSDGSTPFAPEKDRYHLYIGYFCPYAQLALAAHALKGLEDVIPVTCVDYFLDPDTGLRFVEKEGQIEGCAPEPLYGAKYLSELYFKAYPQYEGRFTVPMLWDRKHETIVNNESAELLRIFNSEFNAFAKNPDLDLCPEKLRDKIDEFNNLISTSINSNIFKCGFTKDQEEYDRAINELFSALDKVEEQLSKTRYLTGDALTEADVRLFVTLLRFDLVYFQLFKCCKKMIKDYPNIFGFLRELYQIPAIKSTVNISHIRRGMYTSPRFASVNPSGILPAAPEIDFDAPHGRDKQFPASSTV